MYRNQITLMQKNQKNLTAFSSFAREKSNKNSNNFSCMMGDKCCKNSKVEGKQFQVYIKEFFKFAT